MHHAMYSYGDQVQEGMIGGTCGTYGEKKDACRFLAGKREKCWSLRAVYLTVTPALRQRALGTNLRTGDLLSWFYPFLQRSFVTIAS